MKTFTDNSGRAWTVTINVDAVKRVKTLLAINLLDAIEGKLLERLAGDPVLLCDVLYALCKPQADAQSISDEDFGRSMAGDVIDTAATALLEELCDFFPKGRRQLLQKALAKLRTLEETVLTAASRRLDSPDLDRQLQEAIAGGLSGNLPASPASSPAP
ncbi:MAG: hypothetical protein LLG01_15950 [Planctomycetaceae bacterium]|nr:hypothetical protein [Planctomycetaceae bacterium]